jgi:hypothetical protein
MGQIIKGTDMNGFDVQMTVDLSKDLRIENIPEELEWNLDTIDDQASSEATEWVGAMKKR